jgi:hypothetical protein
MILHQVIHTSGPPGNSDCEIKLSFIKDSSAARSLKDQVIGLAEFLAARYPDKVFGSLPDQEKEKISRLAGVLLEVALNM